MERSESKRKKDLILLMERIDDWKGVRNKRCKVRPEDIEYLLQEDLIAPHKEFYSLTKKGNIVLLRSYMKVISFPSVATGQLSK